MAHKGVVEKQKAEVSEEIRTEIEGWKMALITAELEQQELNSTL